MIDLTPNDRMPYMPFNWAEHAARVACLSYVERGVFDYARCTLWKVVGCKMPIDVLKLRMRLKPEESEHLDTLMTPGLGMLTVDADGRVFDAVLVREFEAAVQKAETNRANGKKGGRPSRQQPTVTPGASPPEF